MASLAWSILVLVLAVGLSQTPTATRDSAGRTMGFNDRLYLEHYWLSAKHFSFRAFFQSDHLYDWVLLAMQFVGLWLVLSQKAFESPRKLWFFALQPVIFPFASLGILFVPSLLGHFVSGTLDREAIIDIPFVWCIAHPIWVLTSILAASISTKHIHATRL